MVYCTTMSPVRLFFSYSHKDASYRESMERAISLLIQNGTLQQWSDQQILPGERISPEIARHINDADVVVFLFSPDFIASQACRQEWEYAAQLASEGKMLFRVPIILRQCSWLDMIDSDDVKALPQDGKPIASFDDEDVGWQQVYEGIKSVVDKIRLSFTPRPEFIEAIDKTYFLSQSHLSLQELFVFLRLTCEDPVGGEQLSRETIVSTREELFEEKYALIHGREKSGKTALARHLFLTLVEQNQPVLFLDLAQLPNQPFDSVVRELYSEQYTGDYDLWVQQPNRILVADNLNSGPRLLDFLVNAKEVFGSIYITLSTEAYISFFRDETRLSDFKRMKIEPLSRGQQEELIRKRLALSDSIPEITDGYVDQIEDEVNSIIISERILPRFPFYVLSILQSHEAYMPTHLSVTSYGHCYYVLIVANLMRSGISESDDDVTAVFNFAEELAFAIYRHSEKDIEEPFDFRGFQADYNQRFIIKTSIVSRLMRSSHGLINNDGSFRTDYMYYYFLGKYLARKGEETSRIVSAMCEDSHREANYLTLLFTIHHTTDDEIIDNILLRTMCTLDHIQAASLDKGETRRFSNIVADLPENILTDAGVAQARAEERAAQDKISEVDDNENAVVASQESDSPINGMYRILKNNKIMGQVLRNKHGSLERAKIEEVIAIIADSGLRLINAVLKDEDEITKMAIYLHDKNNDWDLPKVKQMLEYLSFIWAMTNIEEIVDAVNVREIQGAIDSVVRSQSTPAHDLIGYFSQLDGAGELKVAERDKLSELLRKHDDTFIRRVLSIRTQHYMNTHRSRARIEQSICSLLKIRYAPRLIAAD